MVFDLFLICFLVSDARKVRCTGRGLQKNGVRVRDVADFKVWTDGAGEGKLEVKIIGPGGVAEHFESKKIDGTTTEFKYFPKTPGRYTVIVSYGGQEVPKSPFEVNVGKYITSKVRAFGPGLEGGVVGHSADFSVEMNGETAPLGTTTCYDETDKKTKTWHCSEGRGKCLVFSCHQVFRSKDPVRPRSTAKITGTRRPTLSTGPQHPVNTQSMCYAMMRISPGLPLWHRYCPNIRTTGGPANSLKNGGNSTLNGLESKPQKLFRSLICRTASIPTKSR